VRTVGRGVRRPVVPDGHAGRFKAQVTGYDVVDLEWRHSGRVQAAGCSLRSWRPRGPAGESADRGRGQYLLPVLALAAALVWVTRDRAGKVALAGQTAVGLLLVGLGIWLAGTLHVDPRPFVQDPSSPPRFPHAADNGFPSDHGAAGGLLAALVAAHKRALGAVVAAGAVLIVAARVAAHVHHVQDVVAGLAIGAAAGVLAVFIINRLAVMRARRARSRVSLTRYV
jgi:membrane-associated phospholipid phosphatase